MKHPICLPVLTDEPRSRFPKNRRMLPLAGRVAPMRTYSRWLQSVPPAAIFFRRKELAAE
jgi:hypothetical protein